MRPQCGQLPTINPPLSVACAEICFAYPSTGRLWVQPAKQLVFKSSKVDIKPKNSSRLRLFPLSLKSFKNLIFFYNYLFLSLKKKKLPSIKVLFFTASSSFLLISFTSFNRILFHLTLLYRLPYIIYCCRYYPRPIAVSALTERGFQHHPTLVPLSVQLQP